MSNYKYYTSTPLLGFPLLPLLATVPNPHVPSLSGVSDDGNVQLNSASHWDDEQEKLPWQDLKAIIEKRLNKRTTDRNTEFALALGEMDYLHFSTLEKGVKKGLAVCRISLNTEEASASQLIDLLESGVKKWKIKEKDLRELWSLPSSQEPENIPLDRKRIEKILKEAKSIPIGTGFLVGRNYILTNYHILDLIDDSDINNMFAEFGYEYDYLGRKSESILYRFENVEEKGKNEYLDSALIKLNSQSEKLSSGNKVNQEAGNLFGFIQLNSERNIISPPISHKILNQYSEENKNGNQLSSEISDKLDKLENFDTTEFYWKPIGLLGEPAIIIQHPRGKHKQIVLSNNRVIKINKNFIYYETDADHGSSGSPVFNQQWELVGMNRAAVYVQEEGKETTQQKNLENQFIIGYEGIRICRIANDLRRSLPENILEELNINQTGQSYSVESADKNQPQILQQQQYPPATLL